MTINKQTPPTNAHFRRDNGISQATTNNAKVNSATIGENIPHYSAGLIAYCETEFHPVTDSGGAPAQSSIMTNTS